MVAPRVGFSPPPSTAAMLSSEQNKMVTKGRACRDLWDLFYIMLIYFEFAVFFIDSEWNKVGYTLLYEATVLKYNFIDFSTSFGRVEI